MQSLYDSILDFDIQYDTILDFDMQYDTIHGLYFAMTL